MVRGAGIYPCSSGNCCFVSGSSRRFVSGSSGCLLLRLDLGLDLGQERRGHVGQTRHLSEGMPMLQEGENGHNVG